MPTNVWVVFLKSKPDWSGTSINDSHRRCLPLHTQSFFLFFVLQRLFMLCLCSQHDWSLNCTFIAMIKLLQNMVRRYMPIVGYLRYLSLHLQNAHICTEENVCEILLQLHSYLAINICDFNMRWDADLEKRCSKTLYKPEASISATWNETPSLSPSPSSPAVNSWLSPVADSGPLGANWSDLWPPHSDGRGGWGSGL